MPSPLAILTLSLLSTASASPLIPSLQHLKDSTLNLRSLDFSRIFPRQSCANPCGWSGQVCCRSDQYCYTDSNNQAACGTKGNTAAAGSGSGYWETYTTTFVRTDLVTITSVLSSFVGAPTAATPAPTGGSVQCNYARHESPCGSICCASNQYCVRSGQCGAAAADPAGSSAFPPGGAPATTTTAGFLPPLRPTDSTLITRTATGVTTTTARATSTVAFLPPVAAGANVTIGTGAQLIEGGGGGGLSGGAIAGIVLGVIFGLGLLFLICFLCCLKGLLSGVLSFLGFGKKRRREREVVTEEEEYVRSSRRGGGGGGGSRRDDRSWYGSDRPRRVVREEKRSGGGGGGAGKGLLGIGAGLAGLAALLAGKRAVDRRRDEKSHYSSSAGSQSTSDSSESSYLPPPRTRSRSRTVRSSSRRP